MRNNPKVSNCEIYKKIIDLDNGEQIVLLAGGNFTIKVLLAEGAQDHIGSFHFRFIDNEDGGFYKLTYMFLDYIGGYTRLGIGKECLLFCKQVMQYPIFCGYETGTDLEDGSQLTGNGVAFATKMLSEGILDGQV